PPQPVTKGSPRSSSCHGRPSCCKWRLASSRPLLRLRSPERSPAGRPGVVRPEAFEFFAHLAAQALPALPALIGKLPGYAQYRIAPARRRQRAGAFEQPRFLDVRIVEVAEDALQLLEGGQDAPEIGR